MHYGNMAIDDGHLLMSSQEKDQLVNTYPKATKLIKKVQGAQEFLKGVERWCLWINHEDLLYAQSILSIKQRIESVKNFRLSSSDTGTHKLASKPHQFREMKLAQNLSFIIPTVSSERREYIPIGFVNSVEVVIAPNQVIYDPPTHIFAIISSRIHMTWVRAVAGRLETRIRYSSALCYNTFPFPDISEVQKSTLEDHVFKVLDEREQHSEKTMAQLYDPDKMPDGLRQAHHEMDIAVEQCYRKQPFNSDEERLAYLFKLYEEMIEAEKQKSLKPNHKTKKAKDAVIL